MRATVAMMIISTITRKNHPARTRHKSFSLPAAQLGTPPLAKQKRRQVYKRVCVHICLLVGLMHSWSFHLIELHLKTIASAKKKKKKKKKKSTASKPKIQTRLYHLPKKKNDACFPINFRYAICRCPVQAHQRTDTYYSEVKKRNHVMCVSLWKKSAGHWWQSWQAIPTILQVSSSKHNANKNTTRGRGRGPFHQSITVILTRENREAVTYPTHVAVFFWKFCRTWTKRYLVTSQTRVKRVSRIHPSVRWVYIRLTRLTLVCKVRWVYPANALTLVCEVIRYRLVQVRQNLKKKKKDFSGWQPAIAFLYPFLFHFLLCLISFCSQNKNHVAVHLFRDLERDRSRL